MIKTFSQYNESISEDLSLSDFLYMHLEDVKLYVDYMNKNVEMNKIENEFGVQNFIDDYILLAKKNKQWVGGPLNKEWANKYYQFFGQKSPLTDYKPTIDIQMKFDDGSGFIIGFSILNKRIVKMNWKLDHGDAYWRDRGTIGDEFYHRDKNDSDWGDLSYDGYYDIIHRIIPGYTFNWDIDTTIN